MVEALRESAIVPPGTPAIVPVSVMGDCSPDDMLIALLLLVVEIPAADGTVYSALPKILARGELRGAA